MTNGALLLLIMLLASVAYALGRRKATAMRKAGTKLHSLPRYYGYMVALGVAVPALLLMILWSAAEPSVLKSSTTKILPLEIQSQSSGQVDLILNDIKNLATGGISQSADDPVRQAAADHYQSKRNTSRVLKTVLVLLVALAGAWYAWQRIAPNTRARVYVERAIIAFLIACSSIAILTTVGIVLSVLFESLRFFQKVPFTDFAFGLKWSPQTAIRADQVGSSGAFGAIPLFRGTLIISAIAMLVAIPFGLLSAIFLAEYASPKVRAWAKPLLEILAGIPTVVYGFFAALTVAPAIRNIGDWIDSTLGIELAVSSESALAAGLVMGIMIIPFVSSLSDDVITAVPQQLRDGSLGLGATKSETIKRVVIPAALPGIVGGILLAVSRAIGETMIVVMAAGVGATEYWNPLKSVTTITVQIVTLLTGDQEFDSAKTLAAFALGLMLFVTTLILNVIALHVVRKYREQYE